MKKTLIIVLVLTFVPLFLFADLGLGASAFFNSPVLVGTKPDVSELREGGFTFGGDLRFKFLKILQLETLGLVTVGDAPSIDLYADAGLAFDLAFLSLSAGVGPTVFFLLDKDAPDPTMLGFNAKANVDIKLGRISFGLSYIMGLIVENGIKWDKSTGMLGANILFWL